MRYLLVVAVLFAFGSESFGKCGSRAGAGPGSRIGKLLQKRPHLLPCHRGR